MIGAAATAAVVDAPTVCLLAMARMLKVPVSSTASISSCWCGGDTGLAPSISATTCTLGGGSKSSPSDGAELSLSMLDVLVGGLLSAAETGITLRLAGRSGGGGMCLRTTTLGGGWSR